MQNNRASLRDNIFHMSHYIVGDEIAFKFEGILFGTVERVEFQGRKVRYHVSLNLSFDVPDSLVVTLDNDAPQNV